MADPQSDDPLLGQTLLGKLKVIRLLGAGGMGAVYEVEHTMTRHHRALKLLHAHVADNPEVVARFLREASVAGTLKTKHVVETFDAGQLEDGKPYVLMEMLAGKSLAEVLEDSRLLPGRVASLVWEACEGLSVAHRGGIVHRDMKPDNLFVAVDIDGNEIVKVLDFGISKFSERHDYEGTLTADGAMMGTPFYMSPEQTRGLKDIDGRTDIYAMGVILYEALSGRVPFSADSFPMLVVSIHEGDCAPLTDIVPDIDPALAAVAHQAMATEREDRYASVRDLQEALRPFADRELPERMGTNSALVLGETMASDVPPRLSAASTPMAWAEDKTGAEPAGGARWPLWAGVGLMAVGLIAGGIALSAGGDDDASPDDAQVRGLIDEGGPVAASQPVAVVDSGAARVVDAGADADADAQSAALGDEREAATPTMERTGTGRMNMRSMSAMSTMTGSVVSMGIEVETDIY